MYINFLNVCCILKPRLIPICLVEKMYHKIIVYALLEIAIKKIKIHI